MRWWLWLVIGIGLGVALEYLRERNIDRTLRKYDQRGQTLIIFALALPVFFAFLVLVIDGAQIMIRDQQLQNTADAAALAAAQELPTNAVAACPGPDTNPDTCQGRVRAAAEEYSRRNGGTDTLDTCAGPGSQNCYAIRHGQGGVPKVEVRLASTVVGYVAHINATVHAAASAAQDYRYTIHYQGAQTVTNLVTSTVSLIN